MAPNLFVNQFTKAKAVGIFLLTVVFAVPCWAGQISAQDQAAIYRLVLLRLIGPDDTYGGQLHPKKIYVSETLFVAVPAEEILHLYGPPELTPSPPPPPTEAEEFGSGDAGFIRNDVEKLLTEDLRSQGRNVYFVTDVSSAPKYPAECASDGGPFIIAVSAIQELSQIRVFVQGQIYCGPVFATAYYELAKVAGGWHIKRVMGGVET